MPLTFGGPDSVPPEHWENPTGWLPNERLELSPRDPEGYFIPLEDEPKEADMSNRHDRDAEDLMKFGERMARESRRAAQQTEPLSPGGDLGAADAQAVKQDRRNTILNLFADHQARDDMLRATPPSDHAELYRRYKQALGVEPGSHRRGELS